MATDPFFQEEADRLQARLPGGSAGGRAPTFSRTPLAAASAAPSPAVAPSPSGSPPSALELGRKVRTRLFRDTNRGVSALERGINLTLEPARTVVNPTASFAAGLAGRRSAVTPIGEVALPRLQRGPRPRGGLPMALANRDDPNTNLPGPGAMTAGGAPSGAEPAAAMTGTPSPRAVASTDLGTFMGDQGYRTQGFLRSSPGRLAATSGAAPATTPFNANAAVAPAVDSQRRVARLVRGDAAKYLSPASQQAEMMRRAENAAGSYFLKGRTGARNAIVAANLGQIATGNAASGQFQRAAGEAINAGAEGAVRQGLGAEADAARSRLQRDAIDGQLALAGQRYEAAANEPREVIGDDGVMRVRRGTQAAPVLDEAGNPLRMPSAPSPGALTPKDLLAAYTKGRESIAGSLGPPEAKAAALAALDANPLYQPLVGGGTAPPDRASFLAAARATNPGVSDEELAEYFERTYGSGQGAR